LIKTFNGFKRDITLSLTQFVTLTKYASDINATVLYQPPEIHHTFGEIVANHGLRQLRIAETEKYAHVTFFFNGGIETPFAGEDRLLIPSPRVATYDLAPQMSAPELTEKLIENIASEKYDVIICNFANADMVGHTGNFPATVSAIECLDQSLGSIVNALQKSGGEMVITADHGNAEHMYNDQTGQPHTAHTNALVPFIYLGREASVIDNDFTLIDVVPTLLYLMNIDKPSEMSGKSIIQLSS